MAVALAVHPQPVIADHCDAVAAQIAAKEGATINRRTLANIIFLNHPLVSAFSIGCPSLPSDNPDLIVDFDGAYPTAQFYQFVARAGEIVTGAPLKVIRDGATRCQQAALKSKDELAELEFRGITFECQSFTHGDGGTFITIYRKSKEQKDREK